MKISKLYVYPIKSMRGCELESAQATRWGFAYDRRFMLLQVQRPDDGGSVTYKNMAVADYPKMTLFFPRFTTPPPQGEEGKEGQGEITITYKPPYNSGDKERSTTIPLVPDTDGLETVDITMHLSPTQGYLMPRSSCDFLSDCFGYEVILVYLGANRREVLMSTSSKPRAAANGGVGGWMSSLTSKATQLVWGGGDDDDNKQSTPSRGSEITFSDCAPYLVVSDKSMEDVHHRLPDGEQMEITKFRPNVIVSGAGEAWEEDFWGELTVTVGERGNGVRDETDEAEVVRIECAQNCGRCKSINIDFATGQPGKGPSGKMLAKLQSNRRVDPGSKYSPVFGRYCFLGDRGESKTISVGDEVVVSRINEERTRFDWKGLCTT